MAEKCNGTRLAELAQTLVNEECKRICASGSGGGGAVGRSGGAATDFLHLFGAMSEEVMKRIRLCEDAKAAERGKSEQKDTSIWNFLCLRAVT